MWITKPSRTFTETWNPWGCRSCRVASHAIYAACTTTVTNSSCWLTGSTSANAAAHCAMSSSTPNTTTQDVEAGERRCRRETALTLISPVDYGMVEQVYEGNTWMMAVELGVTIQVLNDYRQLLHDSGVCVQ
mgnify:CR=1 FL=1